MPIIILILTANRLLESYLCPDIRDGVDQVQLLCISY